MMKSQHSTVPVSEFVWGTGRWGSLHGKVDATSSYNMCTCSVGSAQCSVCVVNCPGAMAAI